MLTEADKRRESLADRSAASSVNCGLFQS